MRLEAANVPFPEDKQELKEKIDRLAIRIGYNNSEISLIESKTGDLHSNASTTKDSIKLSSELLKHHEGHDEEVLAIVAHELGHNKK